MHEARDESSAGQLNASEARAETATASSLDSTRVDSLSGPPPALVLSDALGNKSPAVGTPSGHLHVQPWPAVDSAAQPPPRLQREPRFALIAAGVYHYMLRGLLLLAYVAMGTRRSLARSCCKSGSVPLYSLCTASRSSPSARSPPPRQMVSCAFRCRGGGASLVDRHTQPVAGIPTGSG